MIWAFPSPQLDDASRGFSYMQDAPLDMRMDTSAPLTAYEVVNQWSYEELRRILYEYGEERYAPAIAKAVVRTRETRAIETTLELVDVIKGAMPPAALREKQHPAKRSFQAIRIAVNGELDALPPMLKAAVDFLNPGGRLAVITFHSLEDRIVKRAMQDMARGCTCPPEFPVCVCRKEAEDQAADPEADRFRNGGVGGQPPRPQRKAASGGEMRPRFPVKTCCGMRQSSEKRRESRTGLRNCSGDTKEKAPQERSFCGERRKHYGSNGSGTAIPAGRLFRRRKSGP